MAKSEAGRRSRAEKPGKGRKARGTGVSLRRKGLTPPEREGEKPKAARGAKARSDKKAGGAGRGRRVRAGKPTPGGPREGSALSEALSEEDAIRSAKYLPRDLPRRLFEEERFLFPESYGVNRVRLLVKDPEWLFAYWDVNPASLAELGQGLGERAMALSRLTLRITDPVHGGSSDILLPPGARWWYVRSDSAPRSYRAELGVTLPSGEFRKLAESNTVVTPRVGPSSQRATRRITYDEAQAIPPGTAVAAREEMREAGGTAAGPWQAPSVGAAPAGGAAPAVPGETATAGPGGASDSFQPGGASDVFRR